MQAAQLVPPYGSREVLVLLSALSTCDPGNIFDALKSAQAAKLKVSIVGLSADMHISRRIAEDSGGTYNVALSKEHLDELVMQLCTPPAVPKDSAAANLVRMAFPNKDAEGTEHAAFVGEGGNVTSGAYTCPVCKSKNAHIPGNCHVCGVQLIASAHLARSYHHLFPLPGFAEVPLTNGMAAHTCAFCQLAFKRQLPGPQAVLAPEVAYKCPRCHSLCCADCDEFVHDHLHNCPGCEAKPD